MATEETFEAKVRRLWPHFIHSFGLADHLGDAGEDVRQLAKLLGLPMPSDYAEFCGSKDDPPEESWTGWARAQVEGEHIGIWSDAAKGGR